MPTVFCFFFNISFQLVITGFFNHHNVRARCRPLPFSQSF